LLSYLSEARNVEAAQLTAQMTPCSEPLPDLEVPMINAIVACLGSEHRKLNSLVTRLALMATRPVDSSNAAAANRDTLQIWDEMRRTLWSHLQIEDELVYSWGVGHHAVSGSLLTALNDEREKLRKLLTDLPAVPSGAEEEPQILTDHRATLLALTAILDSHVERYDDEVLPAIRRALFRR
jgi:hemerythrin-like domain-containing protein